MHFGLKSCGNKIVFHKMLDPSSGFIVPPVPLNESIKTKRVNNINYFFCTLYHNSIRPIRPLVNDLRNDQ